MPANSNATNANATAATNATAKNATNANAKNATAMPKSSILPRSRQIRPRTP